MMMAIVSLGWWFGAIGIAIAITMFLLFVWFISHISLGSGFGYEEENITTQISCIITVVWIIAITLCLTLGGESKEQATPEIEPVKEIYFKLGEPEPLEIDASED